MKSTYNVYVQNPPHNVFDQEYFKKLQFEKRVKTYYLSQHGLFEQRNEKMFDVTFIPSSIEHKTLYLMDDKNKEIAYIVQKISQTNRRVYNIPVDHIKMICTEFIYKQTLFNIIKRKEVVQDKTFHRIFIELKCELNDYVLNELSKVLLLFHAP